MQSVIMVNDAMIAAEWKNGPGVGRVAYCFVSTIAQFIYFVLFY